MFKITNRSGIDAFRAVVLAALCGLAAACASSDLPLISAAQANSELTSGYRIDAGEKLKVTVFDEETLTGEYDVGFGGVLSLPLLEPIVVKDKDTTEVARLIEARLADGGYVLDPRVSIEIVDHRSFFILGEVTTPGEYAHNGELTLEQAVAKAGGFTPRADKHKVILKRQTWEAGRLIDLDQMALQVAPGDTITIRESFF
ncbi:polysaccharide biosynthesis/export family protein [Qipengyuania psychrotolerans]|uniref:Polysaccharide export protein n=1 Tax=Qipengyuania psychrotolerans TaxID=2867238 RepID=A0ABX8ZC29_9SPHN|nr:polysaccharide biosynthesis/export family protein [Qipengyuania psychrotolerans]QZD86550.1 polysaccharide export protein [Qipengyuania psychrotolerans]